MTTESDEPGFDTEEGFGAGEVKAEQTRADVLHDDWKPLGEWPESRPAARRFLVSRREKGNRVGVLPLGKVGMVAGAGAAGKSWLTTQLAVAVAAGGEAAWVGLEVDTPGRVLLVLGEEEAEEASRRLHYIGHMLELTGAQRKAAAERLVMLPMAGRDVALTKGLDEMKDGELPTTTLYGELVRRLKAGGPWSLVVLDPLARFAGEGTETDGTAGTRFVQALEALVRVPGNPTVLVTHHTSQAARQEGAKGKSDAHLATASRGHTSISDAVRWQAHLEAFANYDGAPRIRSLQVAKNNYAPPSPLIDLTAPSDGHGALRKATPEELDHWKKADAKAKARAKAKAKAKDEGVPAPAKSEEAEPTPEELRA